VEFVTLADKTMPFVGSRVLDWPYVEGLRLDEAMHPLTLLAFGMYGEVLPNQNGAPVRLVVPWKYGFKSGKSIVKIRFVEKEPKHRLEQGRAQEYGFLFQREPRGGPPALEPGHRAAHRRRRPVCQEAQDADVQRLRGPGGAAVRRHGPQEVLLMGFVGFVLLTPLAATSFNRAVRALGARRWQRLHKAVYAIAVLGVLHFFWMRAGKNDFGEVAVYAAILAVLLGWRVVWYLKKKRL
jgi:hypothetical protein